MWFKTNNLKQKNRKYWQWAVLSLLFLLVGCQTMAEKRQSRGLQETLKRYESVIRWGNIQQAHSFKELTEEPAPLPVLSAPVRVIQYETVQGPTMVSNDKAVQTVLIQYVFQDSQVVKQLSDQQTWSYDPEKQQWHLLSQVPEFSR